MNTTRRAVEFLLRVEAGEEILSSGGGQTWYEWHTTPVWEFESGWKLCAFRDGVREWDYIEWIEDPNGKRILFEDFCGAASASDLFLSCWKPNADAMRVLNIESIDERWRP